MLISEINKVPKEVLKSHCIGLENWSGKNTQKKRTKGNVFSILALEWTE